MTIDNTVIEEGESFTVPVEEDDTNDDTPSYNYPPFLYNPTPDAPMISVEEDDEATENAPVDDANPNTGASVVLSAPIALAMLAGAAALVSKKK